MLDELMTKIEVLELSADEKTGKFAMGPLERGYGQTIGNSLRRIMLSSLEGSSASKVKFQGVYHEFSVIPGVMEDVPEIILNIKGIASRIYGDGPVHIHVDIKGPKVVTAGDLAVDSELEIVNTDHYICTLNEEAELVLDMEFIKGKGYRLAEMNKEDRKSDVGEDLSQEVAVIPIDSSFTPVELANFTVENVRVGNITDYDKLILDVVTNGTVTPQEALSEAASILISYLNLFLDLPEYKVEEEEEEAVDTKDLEKVLSTNVESLELSLRSFNCLMRANLHTVGDIISKTRSDMLGIKNFGKKSIAEVESKIRELGFEFKEEDE